MISQTIQDYLKTIYDLLENTGEASTTALASRLGISPASVTGMLQRLASDSPPLVIYRKHQGVTLTHQGKKAALEVIRHHRLIETYLVENLGYTWDEVHAEAEQLEHFISEDFESRIAAALGHPIRDPHGELIPTAELTMPSDPAFPLSSLEPPKKAVVIRVRAGDAALLRHFENLGIVPGVQIQVLMVSPFDHNLSLKIGNQPDNVIIGETISKQIFVELATIPTTQEEVR